MQKICAVALLGTLAMGDASAGITIQGPASCGQWVTSRREIGEPVNLRQMWVLGYLSGLAMASGKNFWGTPDKNKLDPESAYLWIDDYCRANPRKRTDEAADALFHERCPTATACPQN